MYIISDYKIDSNDDRISAKVMIKEGTNGNTEIHILNGEEYLTLKDNIEKIKKSTITSDNLISSINTQYDEIKEVGVNALKLGGKKSSDYALATHNHEDLTLKESFGDHVNTVSTNDSYGHSTVITTTKENNLYSDHASASANEMVSLKKRVNSLETILKNIAINEDGFVVGEDTGSDQNNLEKRMVTFYVYDKDGNPYPNQPNGAKITLFSPNGSVVKVNDNLPVTEGKVTISLKQAGVPVDKITYGLYTALLEFKNLIDHSCIFIWKQ